MQLFNIRRMKSLTKGYHHPQSFTQKGLYLQVMTVLVLGLSQWHTQTQAQTQTIASSHTPSSTSVSTSQPPSYMADLPGVNLWYTDTGGTTNQEILILLHPNTGSSEIWSLQSEVFSKAGYRVIAFDRRGWGKSTAKMPTDNGAQSIAEDLEALVQYLKIERFHLLGIAGGGFAAVDYAAWKPQRLKSLIVGGSTAQLSEPSMKETVERIEIPGIRKIPSHFREVGPSYRTRAPEGTRLWMEIEERSQQPNAKSQPLRTPNTFEKIKTIKSPTLIIAGGADLLAPPALMRMWVKYLDHPQWVLLPEAGHALSWEEPELFNEAVLGFLRNH